MTQHFQQGFVVAGYRLERLLGRGGMGSVWVGQHQEVGHRRAIKLAVLHSDQARARFEREARALARVGSHPGVVGVHDYGLLADGVGYLVLDLVEGADLEAALEDGALPLARAARLVREVAQALAYLHERGVVHRDVKPANVLITREGRAILADFGVARELDSSRLTATGAVVGSPHYLAPEWLDAATPVGPSADVYSLGVVLYQLLTGQRPYEGESFSTLLAAVTSGMAAPPSQLNPDLDPALDGLVLGCLALDPGERPSAARLADALSAVEGGEYGGLDLRASRASRLWRRLRRGDPRSLAVLVFVALLVALVGAGLAHGLRSFQAQRVLSKHLAWEERELTPWHLGITGRPPPATPDRLGARIRALEAAEARLQGQAAQDARVAVSEAKAALRALAHREGADVEVPPADGRTSAELLTDALVLADRGEHERALERLSLARDHKQGLTGRLLQLTLLARSDPEGFLRAWDACSPGPLHDHGERLSPQALLALHGDRLEAALPPQAPLHAVEALEAAGERLPVAQHPAAVAQKSAGLDGVSEEWARRLSGAAARDREAQPLGRLIRLLLATPPCEPGPALRAALEGVLEALALALDAPGIAPEQALRSLRRLVRVDNALHEKLGMRWTPRPEAARPLGSTLMLHTGDEGLAEEMFLPGMRWGVASNARELSKWISAEALARLRSSHPKSRSVILAQLQQATGGDGDWDEARRRYLADLEEALASGPDDLADPYLCEAYLLAAQLILPKDPVARPYAVRPEAAARVLRHVEAVRSLAPRDLKLFSRTFTYRARALEMQGRQAEALPLYSAAIAAVKERQAKRERERANTLASLHRQLGEALERQGRLEEAEVELRAAVQLFPGERGSMNRERYAWFLQRRGRAEEALEVALAGFPSGYEDRHLSRRTARLLRQLRPPAELRAFLAEGLRLFPRQRDLRELRDELGSAED